MKSIKSLMLVMTLGLVMLAGCVNVIEAPEDEAMMEDVVTDDSMMEDEGATDSEEGDVMLDVELEEGEEGSMVGELELKDEMPEVKMVEDKEMLEVQPADEEEVEMIKIEPEVMKVAE